jgi:LysR family hydrogen peroxide-inducible transcriptional activator
LEEELDLTLFDRKSHPICPTESGRAVIDQARVILFNIAQLKELTRSEKEVESGTVRIGVIPTVAPYILPRLLKQMQRMSPQIELRAFELRTAVIIEQLRKAELDMAILATPLEQPDFLEIPLYYEKFAAYVSPSEELYGQAEITAEEMPTEHLWVLKEGHCMRNQVFNFCQTQSAYSTTYEAGSIDTLIKIVDENGGYTVIPELHLPLLHDIQQQHIRHLSAPTPVREISLVIRQDYVRERLINAVADAVKAIIPDEMLDARLKKFAIRL